jgi:hypothetical protein
VSALGACFTLPREQARSGTDHSNTQAEEQESMIMMAQAFKARSAMTTPGTAEAARAAEPAELRHRRVRLTTGSAAAAHAAGHVIAAIVEWRVPVDSGVAGILASDLIINAVTNGAGDTLMLAIRCTDVQFRVEVHDASVQGDSWETRGSDADAERGLLLAAALAAESGHYRTPAGRAVYYALEFAPVVDISSGNDPRTPQEIAGDEPTARGAASGDGEP